MYMSYCPKGSSIKVEWEDLGEGLCGDYDPDDPLDQNMLRFTVLKNDEQIDDASYCTWVPVSSSKKDLRAMLKYIYYQVLDPLTKGNSIKKLCERLSWIDKEWVCKTR